MPAPEGSGGPPPVTIGLGLGSNIGDKAANIKTAVHLLQTRRIVKVTALSAIYRTAPWGYVDQDFFANACALGETRLDPHGLLAAIKDVERGMGRSASVRWGPRLIDIDILFYGEAAFEDRSLQLPHKELFERAFVLKPLAEIAPELRLLGRSVKEAAERFANEPLEKWDEAEKSSPG